MNEQEYLAHLRGEHSIAMGRYNVVWNTMGNTLLITISGGVIGLIYAFEKCPGIGSVFVLFALILVGWYLMMDIQGKELTLRNKYIVMLEDEIRRVTKAPFPCIEAKFFHVLYGTWRYSIIAALTGLPVLVMYIVVARQALKNYGSAGGVYPLVFALLVLCPVMSAAVSALNQKAMDMELSLMRAELLKYKESLDSPAGLESSLKARG